MCTRCELKGHTTEACHINLKRRYTRKNQTVYMTDSYIKCIKCDLDGHSAERCYINLRRRRENLQLRKTQFYVQSYE